MRTRSILNGIKAKGGLYGKAAEMYMNDEKKSDLFIKECAEQCHNQAAIDHWGEELVSDIVQYSQRQLETAI